MRVYGLAVRVVRDPAHPAGQDQTVVLDGDAATATGAGITVEPAGGSTEPIALFDFGASA